MHQLDQLLLLEAIASEVYQIRKQLVICVKTNALCSILEDASAETSGGQQCKSGAAPLAHNFSYKQCEAEASDTEHQWACKDVLETIEAVPYHEVFIHSFGDYDTRGL